MTRLRNIMKYDSHVVARGGRVVVMWRSQLKLNPLNSSSIPLVPSLWIPVIHYDIIKGLWLDSEKSFDWFSRTLTPRDLSQPSCWSRSPAGVSTSKGHFDGLLWNLLQERGSGLNVDWTGSNGCLHMGRIAPGHNGMISLPTHPLRHYSEFHQAMSDPMILQRPLDYKRQWLQCRFTNGLLH